jgi:hypothetical protein
MLHQLKLLYSIKSMVICDYCVGEDVIASDCGLFEYFVTVLNKDQGGGGVA